jgi:hypothetical protein
LKKQNMIKKLKIGLLIAVLSLAVGVVNSVYAASLVWSNDTVVNLTSSVVDLTIVGGSSNATAFVSGPSSIIVTVAAGEVFTVKSATVDISSDQSAGVAHTCTAGVAQLVLTGSGAGVAHTITVSGPQCGIGGSSGGGGSYTPPVVPPVTPPVVSPETPQGCSGGNLFNTSTGNACVNNPAVPEGCGGGKAFSPVNGQACPASSTTTDTTTTTTTYNFGTATLKNGSKGAAVMELQRFLNAKLNLGLVVDGKLGPKTIAVIKNWQKANGLVADGLIGAKTKAKMNAQ